MEKTAIYMFVGKTEIHRDRKGFILVKKPRKKNLVLVDVYSKSFEEVLHFFYLKDYFSIAQDIFTSTKQEPGT